MWRRGGRNYSTCKEVCKPPPLGEKLDKYLQEMIVSMRSHGSPIGTGVVKGIGEGILLKHYKCSLEEFGIKLTKEWAKSIMMKWRY